MPTDVLSASAHASAFDDDESIYNLIPRIEAPKPKEAMYRSKYPHDVPPSGSTFGRSIKTTIPISNVAGDYAVPAVHKKMAATIGPPAEQVKASVKPTAFVTTKRATLPPASKFSYTERARKPAVPSKNDAPKLKRNQKNFLTENALQNILAAPKKVEDNKVDYISKPDYGRVPDYLHEVKAEVASEKEQIRQMLAAEMEEEEAKKSKMKLLSEEDRLELLSALKKKWEEVNSQYQGMTHLVVLDTMTKIRKKEDYENQLAQLEKSIEKLSKKLVYVADD